MKKIKTLIALFAGVTLLSSCGSAKKMNGWYTDFEEAKKVANSKNKNIVLFVSSLYDGTGTEDGVSLLIDTPEFTKAVQDDFVCVYFDFNKIPEILGQSTDSLTGSELKKLEKKQDALRKQLRIADLYGVMDTPCALIVSKQGYFITKIDFDYLDTSVSGYKDFLYMEIGTVQDFEENLAKTKKGTLAERMDMYDTILSTTDERLQPSLAGLCREAVELDKKNETGLVGKFIMTLASVEAFDALNNRKFDEASKVYQKYAADERVSADEKQVLLFYAAQVYTSSGMVNHREIKRLLTESLEADPESQYASDIESYIKDVEAVIAESDKNAELSADAK